MGGRAANDRCLSCPAALELRSVTRLGDGNWCRFSAIVVLRKILSCRNTLRTGSFGRRWRENRPKVRRPAISNDRGSTAPYLRVYWAPKGNCPSLDGYVPFMWLIFAPKNFFLQHLILDWHRCCSTIILFILIHWKLIIHWSTNLKLSCLHVIFQW